jgi:very-short-patch-repair endonuclease
MGIRFTTKDLFDKGFSIDKAKGIRVGKNKTIRTEIPNSVLVKKEVNKQAKKKGASVDGKSFIEFALMAAKIDYTKEYRFDTERKFRFDYAIPEKKVGIEYDGLMSDKSRHTTIEGFTRDCNKTNLAQIKGWKVLRYTAINYKNIVTDLNQL